MTSRGARLGSRTRLNITLFHNQFTNEIEFVSSNALPALGIPLEVATASGFGATINSSDFRAEGVETEIQYRISNSVQARGDTPIWTRGCSVHSRATHFLRPSIVVPRHPDWRVRPPGGARPSAARRIRIPVRQLQPLASVSSLSGTFVGRRDDSTFLLFSDANFGNTLLLPNRNLDGAYQKLDLSGSFRFNNYLTWYASMENLLSQRYDAAFGFPRCRSRFALV